MTDRLEELQSEMDACQKMLGAMELPKNTHDAVSGVIDRIGLMGERIIALEAENARLRKIEDAARAWRQLETSPPFPASVERIKAAHALQHTLDANPRPGDKP